MIAGSNAKAAYGGLDTTESPISTPATAA
jgi:hypothetical protein